jgi:hypothetical protein
MGRHDPRIAIARPAAEVFALLANPVNPPRWQPARREGFRAGPERIRVIGGGAGAAGLAREVRFAADPDARRLPRATEAGMGCAGGLRVKEVADGAAVELSLRPGGRAEAPEAVARRTGDPGLGLDAALRAGLEAAKRAGEAQARRVDLASGGSQDDPARAPPRDSRPDGASATQNADIARPETTRPEGPSPGDAPAAEDDPEPAAGRSGAR